MRRILIVWLIVCVMLVPATVFGTEAIKLHFIKSLYVNERGDGLSRPDGAGCTDKNLLVVSDTGNSQVLKYAVQDQTFKFEGEVKIPQLVNPGKVQVNSKGEVLIFDEKQVRIVRLSADGAFAGYVEPSGMPAPTIWTPRSLAVDRKDNIYLLDIASERVLVLDPSGKYLRDIKYPKEYGFFSDVTVTMGGTVLALDTVQCRVYTAAADAQVFSPLSAPFKEYALFPTSITTDASGLIIVVDQNGGALVVLNQNGTVLGKYLGMGWKEGQLRYPSQVCVSELGTLFIADRENNRIQVFSVTR
jgi:hypothetical protein